MTKGNIKAPHPLIDALLAENKLKNDAELCRQLGVEPSNVSKIRAGTLDVSDTMRVKIMRRFRWPLKRLDELAPPTAHEAAAGAAQ